MSNKALLLANLGSPDDCSVSSIKRYLEQFLMDPSVIQVPWILRRMIVSLFVLPSRPKSSAEAYQQIWTDKGSPLISFSEDLAQAVRQKTNLPVFLAMRYGNPSIESQILAISKNKDINEILFVPLYPHYAESTVNTSIKEIRRVLGTHKLNLSLSIKPVFYNEPQYISALVKNSAPYIFERVSSSDNTAGKSLPHVLFSYHGLPELHLTNADPTKNHCLKVKHCCMVNSDVHQTCYRHQVMETTRLFVEKAGLNKNQYSISFQSRLGRAKWLEPSTENTLKELAEKGIKDLVVLCPAFVTDCLETLEEIAIRGRKTFLNAGGRSLRLIPCLNAHPDWVETVASWTIKNSL